MPLRRAIPLLVALCLAPAAARAQEGSAGGDDDAPRLVKGRVLDSSGWPLADARVYVLPDPSAAPPGEGSHPLLKTSSDGEGRFSFPLLPPGTYRIDIEAPDHQAAHVGLHLPEADVLPAPVEVHLWPVTTRAVPPAESQPHLASPKAPEREAAAEAEPPAAEAPPASTSTPGAGRETRDGLGDEVTRALAANQIPQALALLEGVGDKRREDADLFYAVGEALLRAGDTAEAVTVLGGALERDPDHAPARYRRALGLLGLGRLEEARAEFERVLDGQPDGPLAERARTALSEMGQTTP